MYLTEMLHGKTIFTENRRISRNRLDAIERTKLTMQFDPEIEVSVVVLTYNSSLTKIKETLHSILMQKGVSLEIIVADDGSKENFLGEITEFFNSLQFDRFVFVGNKENRGTVANFYSGLLRATGKYVKAISPGDRLYKKDTLRNWVDYVKKAGLQWSFSEAIYYRLENGIIEPVSVTAHPNNIKLYLNGSEEERRWQYLVLADIAVGSSMLGTRDLQIKYCKELLNKVTFAEDNMWRIMMFDGIVGAYYPEHTVLYEYGSGISTSQGNVWSERLRRDWRNADQIIFSRKASDSFQQKMIDALKVIDGSSKFNKLFIRNKLKNKLMRKRKTISYLP